ncbi:MAG: beta-ketoacyl-ACP synthase II [bacterium]
MERRVVITGLGAVTPIGSDVRRFWDSLVKGKSGIAHISAFDPSGFRVRIAGEVKDFDPATFMDRKELRRTDRFTHLAYKAALEALKDSGIDVSRSPERVGVLIGSGIGGVMTWEEQHEKMLKGGPDRVSPLFVPMMIIDTASGFISIKIGAKGPNFSTVSACASGAHAIGVARDIIACGMADAMIAGGSEAPVTPLSLAGFSNMKALSTRNNQPEKASRPFDRERDGFIMSEGAGVLVLEELESARKREAEIYVEIGGFGMSSDAYHITAPAPAGEGAARAMAMAVERAGLTPEDIDYVNAHGTSTLLNDKCETEAIKSVFGDHARKLLISSNKSMIGHLLGASGSAELVATAMTIKTGLVPPTINYENPDPDCDLDYVPNEARESRVDAAISNSLGFGGHNVSIVVKALKD